MLIWDASGAGGRTFTKRVIEQQYPYIYHRQSEVEYKERKTTQPGYYLNDEDRTVLFDDYRHKLETRQYINRSAPGLKETLQFIVQPGGKIIHSKALSSQDPTGALAAHGDEAVADALASRLLTLEPRALQQELKRKPPIYSPAWRLQQEELELAQAEREDW
jgi:hypothetical protein